MTIHPDLLQERLERLEAGEPLEAAREGLPTEEAQALEVAALLRRWGGPTIPPSKAAAQRRVVGHAAQQMARLKAAAEDGAGLLNRPWFPRFAAVSGVAFVFLGCALVVGLVGGLAWLGGSRDLRALAPLLGPPRAEVRGTPIPAGLAPTRAGETRLAATNGLVEVQSADGSWRAAREGDVLLAGRRLHTGKLSSGALVFYDGSVAWLGPETEVSLDGLDASRGGSPRVVQLTQWIGASTHTVAPNHVEGSRYEVRTPSGTGVATGTVFHVLVTSSLLARFDVDEGSVAVTSLNVTVLVAAGQSSTIKPGRAPGRPLMRVTGEGEVQDRGSSWLIAGHPFHTNSRTLFLGDPQVGDWVGFEGRILADGTRFADRIFLVRRSVANTFLFRGLAESIQDGTWTIAGRTVAVPAGTRVDLGVVPGDLVEVRGTIQPGGGLVATRIRILTSSPGIGSFEFSGVIEEIEATVFHVSGVPVVVDAGTSMPADLQVGDLVEVAGQVSPEGTWLAREIERDGEDDREFEFAGSVESLDPWRVAGIELATGPRTEIDRGIKPGDRVRVEGQVLGDGIWLASEIERLEEAPAAGFRLVGVVGSLDPWTVSGIVLAVGGETEIEGGIAVGDWVRVEGVILLDGTWRASEIERLDASLGCVDTSAIVRSVEQDHLVLLDGRNVELDEDLEVEGEIIVASVVRIEVCVSEDGILTVIRITVTYQFDVLPTPPPDHDHDDDDDDD